MLICVDEAIFERYPTAEIGYLTAQVSVKKSDPHVEKIKEGLYSILKEKGLLPTNFVTHPQISVWREIYQKDFLVSPKTYRSSIEQLLKRVLTGQGIWNISNIVDLYNCCSVLSLIPMGGYDYHKISGNIHIRYAKDGELFEGLGSKEKVKAKSNQIVYSDDARIICWLWNHKDASATCIDENTEKVIFFFDSIQSHLISDALNQLSKHLEHIQATPLSQGILNQKNPCWEIKCY